MMGFSNLRVICKENVVLALLLCIWFQSLAIVVCHEFEVGGVKGWAIPPSNDTQLYNDWASENRFNVDDTLHFMYKKDSVLVVTKEEYDKCRSAHPMFFSNNGNTTFDIDRSGLFYFISGVSGHCERGLKMIIKVLEPESHPPQPANDTTTTPTEDYNHESGGGAPLEASAAVALVSCIGTLFM